MISNQYIVELGGIIVQDVKDADILMTCDAVNLTVKVLGAIMLGLPIVTFKWLSFSVAAGEFQGKFNKLNNFTINYLIFLKILTST